MDTTKLREALTELQSQRNLLDAAIDNIQNVLAMLSSAVSDKKTAVGQPKHKRSYIEDAIAILERAGKPIHVKMIVEAISELRGSQVHRASIESSIIRHIAGTDNAKLAKFAPSTFGLAVWKQPTLAKTA
jgi:hypothetical protein